MPDNQTPSTDTASSSPDSNEPSINHAQPYRTPVTVGETVGKVASWKSPVIWGLVLASVSFAIVATYFLLTPTVRGFGENRARPIRKLPQYVEDFGGTRMTEEEYNLANEKPTGPVSSDPEGPPPTDAGETAEP